MKRFLTHHRDALLVLLLTGSVLCSIWFMWFFAWRSLVSRLVTIGVEG